MQARAMGLVTCLVVSAALLGLALGGRPGNAAESDLAARLCKEAIARQNERFATTRDYLATSGRGRETRDEVSERVATDEFAQICRNVLGVAPVWDTARPASPEIKKKMNDLAGPKAAQ
jgi:hypothetical protein